MSYKITTDTDGYENEYIVKNKDEVISELANLYNTGTGVGIKIIFPDNSVIEYEAFE